LCSAAFQTIDMLCLPPTLLQTGNWAIIFLVAECNALVCYQDAFDRTQQLEEEMLEVASTLLGVLEAWRERSVAARDAAVGMASLAVPRSCRQVLRAGTRCRAHTWHTPIPALWPATLDSTSGDPL
jgi:hypothetical protein